MLPSGVKYLTIFNINILQFSTMEHSFWQLGDELRGQSKVSEDKKWLVAASRLAEQTRSKAERRINLDLSKVSTDFSPRDREAFNYQEDNKFENFNFNMLNMELRLNENVTKASLSNGIYNMNAVYRNPNISSLGNISGSKYSNINPMKEANNSHINNHSNKEEAMNSNGGADKRFKTLPAAETLPRNEVLGGYIFVCNNDTMQEDLKRQLFGNFVIFVCLAYLKKKIGVSRLVRTVIAVFVGLPPRYRDSVRAITPGLPLFLYNYTTHQLHGIFEVCPISMNLMYNLFHSTFVNTN